MSYEEKGTWVYLVVSAAVYAVYLGVILARAGGAPLVEVDYAAPLLWSVGASVVAAIVLRVLVEIFAPSEEHRGDARDREIERMSVLRTGWLIIAGALGALVMALLEWPHFWIANVIYLGFVLQAVVGATVKLVAYRRGF